MAGEAVLTRLLASGCERVDPAILQPADVFLDLVGEDIRRRLFVTTGPDGRELCLRPEFTIPICRHYLSSGTAGRAARYACLGPVFRHRPGESGEFLQADLELLGDTDAAAADAEALALSLDAIAAAGVEDARMRIGDSALFTGLLDRLKLPQTVRRRLARPFGDTPRLKAALAGLRAASDCGRAGVLAALEGADPGAARAVVEDLLEIAGITAVGGRTAAEIADRFLEQAALSGVGAIGAEAADLIEAFLDIEEPGSQAVAALTEFARASGLDLAAPLADFERRLAELERRHVALDALTFAAGFGRRLDYYTGFVFEVRGASGEAPVVGGGRYDALLARLGAQVPVAAVGAAIWIDRLPGSAG